MGKKLAAYQTHLKRSFLDGFVPSDRKREGRGFAVEFERGEQVTKVFLTVSDWTPTGRVEKTSLHSLIVEHMPGVKRGTILNPRSKKAIGMLNGGYGPIKWND